MNWENFEIYVDRAFSVAAAVFIFAAALILIAFAFGAFVAAWNSWS